MITIPELERFNGSVNFPFLYPSLKRGSLHSSVRSVDFQRQASVYSET